MDVLNEISLIGRPGPVRDGLRVARLAGFETMRYGGHVVRLNNKVQTET
jgi:hypothetical protein